MFSAYHKWDNVRNAKYEERRKKEMEEFSFEVNRTITFQNQNNHKLQYKPDNIFIKDIVIGIRPKDTDDWIGYIECKLWNVLSQKDNFWHYANEIEKDQEEKPFLAACNFVRIKNTSKKPFGNKGMSGWAIYISEMTIYEDILSQYSILDANKLRSEVLNIFPTILQYGFCIKPTYLFTSDMQVNPELLNITDFHKIGTINAGKISLFMKTCKL